MMRPNHDLWQRAASFAAKAHRHQVRKDGATPYAAHVFRVAFTLRHVFNCEDDAILAAALLHDTIEDTNVDYDELHEAFGRDVADLVAAMTKDMRLIEEAREAAYDAQLAAAGPRAILIKLADSFDNLSEAREGGYSVASGIARARRSVALAKQHAELDGPRAIVEALIDSRASASR
jgi:(p)ppGpp synthase/HD superfamily hydrolase